MTPRRWGALCAGIAGLVTALDVYEMRRHGCTLTRSIHRAGHLDTPAGRVALLAAWGIVSAVALRHFIGYVAEEIEAI